MQTEPVLIACQGGSWLAVSPPEGTMSIGVFGESEQEAQTLYQEAVERRQELYALANSGD
jgi:hypothetical protein